MSVCMILPTAFSKPYHLCDFINQGIFCLNFSLLCCVQLMLNFRCFMIRMFKAHTLLFHKTGEKYTSLEVHAWKYCSTDQVGGYMLQANWDYRQVQVWPRVKRDSCHQRSIIRTSPYTCMHYQDHILPPPNHIEKNLHLALPKRRLT
jgi:hypothetical protein